MSLPEKPRLLWLLLSLGVLAYAASRWVVLRDRFADENVRVLAYRDSVNFANTAWRLYSTNDMGALNRQMARFDVGKKGLRTRAETPVSERESYLSLALEALNDSAMLGALSEARLPAWQAAMLREHARMVGLESQLWLSCVTAGRCSESRITDAKRQQSAVTMVAEEMGRQFDLQKRRLDEVQSRHLDDVKGRILESRIMTGLALAALLSCIAALVSITREGRRAPKSLVARARERTVW